MAMEARKNPAPEQGARIPFLIRALPCAALCLITAVQAQVRTPPAGPPDPEANAKYIIGFRPGTSVADRAASVSRAGAVLRFNYTIVDAAAVTVPNVNALAAFQRDVSVLHIIPDRAIHAIQAPGQGPEGKGKPGGGSGPQVTPEGVKRVGVPKDGSNGAGVGVAVADTGIDLAHADLAVAPQTFTAFKGTCQDKDGHGTHVTGIIAALMNNSIGVVGVAPEATPYCVKVLNDVGSGTDSTLIAGLNWVRDNAQQVSPPIRVVNMSLGRDGTLDDNPSLRLAVLALYKAGIVVVVAAGNDASMDVRQQVPATYPEVFAVASTTAKGGTNSGCRSFSGTVLADTASYFTTDGAFDTVDRIGVTISAPGEDQENVSKSCFLTSVGILSLKPGGGTTRMSGTSMAAPHVTGIVARLMQGLTGVETIRFTIRDDAVLKGTAPRDSPSRSYTFDGEPEGIAQAP